MKKIMIFAIGFFISLISCIYLVVAYPTVYPIGVTIYNEAEAYEGYTSIGNAGMGRGNSTISIIDMKGNILHEWFIGEGGTIHDLVFKNGHILSNRLKAGKCPVNGCVAAVEERDWYGNIIWTYENDYLHHIAEIMPDGGIVAMFWKELPEELHDEVKGGVPGTEAEDGKMYTDAIKIINRNKEVVWEWHPDKQLNISDWPLGYSNSRKYWPNINRVVYLPEDNSFNKKESLLVSFRHCDTLAIIRIDTKEVVWKWGRGEISHQHDPHLLSNGNIMVFDNGYHRPEPDKKKFSRVIEINPRINEIVWEYAGFMPDRMAGFSFYSFIGGFAERLPNGNTLITETTASRVFEVNYDGQIVWEYVHPITNTDAVFRFSPDEVDWPEQLPPPNPEQKKVPMFGAPSNKIGILIIAAIILVGLLFYFKLKKK